MTNPLPKVDALIIGIGAAGGIASYVLTQAGIDVVALEAGPRRDKADFLAYYDELQAYPYHNPFADVKANKEIPTWRPNAQSPVQAPPVGPIVMDNQVGGTSVHWTGQAWPTEKTTSRFAPPRSISTVRMRYPTARTSSIGR